MLVQIALVALPVLLALSFHELAHGWAARELGDDTADRAGRLSMNPLRHVDPIGTVAVPLLLLAVSSPFLFGWARPVPVDWRKLRNPRRDVALVAAAGPAANLLMLLVWSSAAVVANAYLPGDGPWLGALRYLIQAGIISNGVLMVINLVPVPPLDGSRVLAAFLPPGLARYYIRLEPYGMLIVVVLLVSGLLGAIVRPVLAGLWAVVAWPGM